MSDNAVGARCGREQPQRRKSGRVQTIQTSGSLPAIESQTEWSRTPRLRTETKNRSIRRSDGGPGVLTQHRNNARDDANQPDPNMRGHDSHEEWKVRWDLNSRNDDRVTAHACSLSCLDADSHQPDPTCDAPLYAIHLDARAGRDRNLIQIKVAEPRAAYRLHSGGD
jgi:hypothetical protein